MALEGAKVVVVFDGEESHRGGVVMRGCDARLENDT